ncbi:MAG: hypothetical protein RI967_2651 [Planctomycetota bacterium]
MRAMHDGDERGWNGEAQREAVGEPAFARLGGGDGDGGGDERAAHAPVLELAIEETTSASLELNGEPVAPQAVVRLPAAAPAPLVRARVRIALAGVDAAPFEAPVETVEPGGAVVVDTAGFRTPLALLRRSTERETHDLVAEIVADDGRVLATERRQLVVVPASHWSGTRRACATLAAFVTPNSTALEPILVRASELLRERTGAGALDGYLSRSAERAQRIAEACHDALAAHGVAYQLAPASFESEGQKIRMPADLVAAHLGNCLDLSVALAALLEAAGLAPVLLLGAGHAIVGFATTGERFPESVHSGASRMRNRLALGQHRVLEATALCEGRGFGAALAAGEAWLAAREDDLEVVDIHSARHAGIHPLPETMDRADRRAEPSAPGAPSAAPDGKAWVVRQPASLPPLPPRTRTPRETRLEHWRKKLLDLTLRNRLLNDGPRAGIPLFHAGERVVARLEDAFRERSRALRLIARPDGHRGGAMQEATTDPTGRIALARLDEELAQGWLRTTLDASTLAKQATAHDRKAREIFDDTGARALYLAIGYLQFKAETRDEPTLAPILLVPAEMRRISKAEGHAVRATGEDAVVNAALVEYMRLVHGVDLGLSGELETDDAGLDVAAILARVRERIRDCPGMTVVEQAKLGVYNFRKLPLYQEMEEFGEALGAHPVVGSLLDRSAAPAIRGARLVEPARIDHEAPLASLRLPLAADSSQIAAVASAAGGATFVLQGPPGTGKSQTITNLLAECLARGRRVLFIAEKAAALEVVRSRLERTGLGGFALDLHAEHATKSGFVAQVKDALAMLEAPAISDGAFVQDATRTEALRTRLRAACEALHGSRGEVARETAQAAAPLGPNAVRGDRAPEPTAHAALSVHDAVERRLATSTGAAAAARAGLERALDGALPACPTADDLEVRRAAVARMAAAATAVTDAARDALADLSPIAAIAPEVVPAIERALADARAAVADATTRLDALAIALGAPRPAGPAEAERLLTVARAFAAPALRASLVAPLGLPDHGAALERLARAIALERAGRAARDAVATRFEPTVLALPLDEFAGDLRASRERFVLFRFLAARRVRAALVRHARATLPKALDALLVETDRLRAERDAIAAAKSSHGALEALARDFGTEPATIDLDAADAALEAARVAARVLRQAMPKDASSVAAGAARAVADLALPALVDDATRANDALAAALAPLARTLSPVPAFTGDGTGAAAGFATLEARLARHASAADALPAWSAATTARDALASLGLAPVARALLDRSLDPAIAETATETEILRAWIERRLREDPALADAPSDRMAPLRDAFADGMERLRNGAARATRALAEARARAQFAAAPSAATRIVEELRARQTIRRPIRRIMGEAAEAITAIKPLVLASPLSAATSLPPDFPTFDLVVFDEASQVPVWDAACAIARAHACVVVGDSKQLPPTNFFERRESVSDDDGAASDDELAGALEPLESVLDEAIASGIPQRSLLWHYRSRDERLIEFSNRTSYGGRLQTFPAALAAHPDLGVEFRKVDGVFDRGGTRTNRAEAEEVVAELRRRLLSPDAVPANRSIGVVTFSEAQQRLVQDLLDDALDADATLRARVQEAADAGEGVFVKNLENVQGDERATMVFSVCYGRTPGGAIYHNFGPLNLSGGERRLNVAVTRAREKVVLVSSIRAGDLDPARCRSQGARDLRDYLAYAEAGTAPAIRGAGGGHLATGTGEVERHLADALAARGWKVELHVGRSRDYRVSLALADPSTPERRVLGVELDGRFHRAAAAVVDREIVRTGVLANLGWRTLRVSVLDHLRDADATVERIDRAARAALAERASR